MKILAIRIRNLASLEGNTEIDFSREPLAGAGIFSITGPTGAGKSTILDALCLALFAKTPRYVLAKETGVEIQDLAGNKIGQGDVRAILRDGAGEGFAEVDFIGTDGRPQRARWTVRRARDKADGQMQADQHSLTRLDDMRVLGDRKRESLAETERLLGLNFEQFTRSVLLAQGDFTAFLKASKDDKAALLEKLTGTHIYSEISRRIYETHKQENLILRELNLKREGIQLLSEEEREALATERLSLEKEILAETQRIESLQAAITWWTQLEELQQNRHSAEAALNRALEKQQQEETNRSFLRRVRQAQQARTWLYAMDEALATQQQHSLGLQQLEGDLSDLEERASALNTELEQAGAALDAAIREEERAAPLLQQAGRLDALIEEKAAQQRRVNAQLDATRIKAEAEQKSLESLREAQSQHQQALEKLQEWADSHRQREPLCRELQLVLDKLNSARQAVENESRHQTAQEAVQLEIRQAGAAIEVLAQENIAKRNALEALQQNITILQRDLAASAYESLAPRQTQLETQREKLREAGLLWQNLHRAREAQQAAQQKLQAKQTQLQEEEAARGQSAIRLQELRIRKDKSAEIWDRLRLQAAENVEKLRAALQQDAPCPVCGSKEHPYATHKPFSDELLRIAQEEAENDKSAFEACNTGNAKRQQACEDLKKSLVSLETDAEACEKEFAQRQAAWAPVAVELHCRQVPEANMQTWLDEQSKALKDELEKVAQAMHLYREQSRQYDELREQQQSAERSISDKQNRLLDLERGQISRDERLERLKQDIAAEQQQLFWALETLKPYFPDAAWQTQWQANPVAFADEIRRFAAQWNETSEKIESERKYLTDLSAKLQLAETNIRHTESELNTHAASLAELTDTLTSRNTERKGIFGGDALSLVQQRLQEKLRNTRDKIKSLEADREQNNSKRAAERARQSQLQTALKAAAGRAAEELQRIEHWLATQATTEQTAPDIGQLRELLERDQAWIESEQNRLDDLERTLTEAQALLQERSKRLVEHEQKRLSAQDPESLQLSFAQSKEQAESLKTGKNNIDFRLQEDHKRKKELGGLLAEIEAQALVVDRWAKLNDMVGSADGKKFRQIAQEYTLDTLLGYANVHLEMLSTRYLIQRVADSLALQVLDREMGDEIRTVHSLSGGESFLVSLALALGLASLSSNRMQVESLFIDEGFGSLDPLTLSIAMDALERVHNQGRKVGVISHVQEMTERIPTQIRVNKLSNGKSKVEIRAAY